MDLIDVKESLNLFLDLLAEEDVALLGFLQFEFESALVFSVEGCHAHVVRLLKIHIGVVDDLSILYA